jgi:hypothetical protein
MRFFIYWFVELGIGAYIYAIFSSESWAKALEQIGQNEPPEELEDFDPYALFIKYGLEVPPIIGKVVEKHDNGTLEILSEISIPPEPNHIILSEIAQKERGTRFYLKPFTGTNVPPEFVG